MTHATAIKDLRAALGLSQEDFAERVGLARTNLVSIEAGRRNVPDKSTFRSDMADALGVSMDRLQSYLDGEIKCETFMRDVKR